MKIQRLLLAIGAVLFWLMPSLLWAQTDPNTDPNWDWRNGDDPSSSYPASQYRMYIETSQGTIQALFRNAPWGQPNIWDGLSDNQKEDGWTLVCRDFGTPTRAIFAYNQEGTAYFAIYNKLRGVLRVFFFLKEGQAQMNFTTGSVVLKFGSDTQTATLTHLKPRAFALDKKDSVINNTSSALVAGVSNSTWIWADFPMAFDPTIVPTTSITSPRMLFTLLGTTESQVVIKGSATGIGGQPQQVRDFMTGTSNGAVGLSAALPTTTATGQNQFTAVSQAIHATATNWQAWQSFITKVNSQIPILSGSDPLSYAVNAFKSFLTFSPVIQALPGIGAVAGVIDFFLGGGKQNTPQTMGPTYFGFNIDMKGTITTTYVVNSPVSIVVPASKSNALTEPNFGSNVPLVYNNPVGVFNLTQTPVIKYKSYVQSYGGNTGGRGYNDFQIQNFQYQVNTQSGLVLDSVRAWMVVDPTAVLASTLNNSDPTQDPDLRCLSQMLNGRVGTFYPIRMESAVGGRYTFSTIPVAENAIVGQTIQAPYSDQGSDVTIKVKAVFHRQDNPSAQPVVFIATYEPTLVADANGTGRYPYAPTPPPPPTYRSVNVVQQYDFDGTSAAATSGYGTSVTVSAPATQTVNGRLYNFTQWSDGNTSLTRTVTTPGFSTLTAQYKGHLVSSVASVTGGTSQRRTVQDRSVASTYYSVYESGSKIWLTYSLDGGTTWQPEMYVGDGINPSIAAGWSKATVVWRDVPGTNDTYSCFSRTFQTLGPIILGDKLIIGKGGDAFPNAHPAIVLIKDVSKFDADAIAVYETLNPNDPNPNLSQTQLTAYRYTGQTHISPTDLGHWSGGADVTPVPGSIVNKAGASLNPSLDCVIGSNNQASVVKLAWNSYTYGTDDAPINVIDVPASGTFAAGATPTALPVNASQTVQYQKPSLVTDASGNKYMAWQAFDHNRYPYNQVIIYKYLPSWNDPSYPITEFAEANHSSISPSIQQKSDGSFYLFYQTDAGIIRQAYKNGNGWQVSTVSLPSGGYYPNAGSHSTDARFAYTRNTNAPYVIGFAMGTSNISSNLIGGGGLNGTLGSGPTSVLNTKARISLGDSTATRRFALTFADVSLQSNNTNKPISIKSIADTLRVTSANVLGLLQTKSFTAAGATKLTATLSVRTQNLNRLSAAVSVWAELYDVATNQTLAQSSPVSIAATDTAKDIAAALNLGALSLNGKTVALRARTSGLVPQATGRLEATNILEMGESASGGQSIVAAVTAVPTDFNLKQNYPNPFNPTTTIEYALPQAAMVSLKIYDILGREVQTLVNEPKSAGFYTATFDASRLSSGTYFYKLIAGSFVQTKKMVLVK
jgi:hypothetical protein